MVVAWDFSHATGYNRRQSMMMCIARCWKLLIFVKMRLTIRSRVYNDKHGQLIKCIKTKNNY